MTTSESETESLVLTMAPRLHDHGSQLGVGSIRSLKVAPGNPYGDDDEKIAYAILAKVRSEREGPDPFTFVVNA